MNGDYSSNLAMVNARLFKRKPLDVAQILKALLEADDQAMKTFEKVDVAGLDLLTFT